MQRAIHTFDNGVKVYDDHLIPVQRNRYQKQNVHEAEEENIFLEILRAIPPNGCFLNVGAAIGYYPILAKKLFPELTIHAVEPLERHRKYLIENIKLNGLKQHDFIIHTVAISSSVGEARFCDQGYGSSIQVDSSNKPSNGLKAKLKSLLSQTGSSKNDAQQVTKGQIIKIRTRTLDDLCQEIGKPVDLCQMDVQGREINVLEGSLNTLKTGDVKSFLIGTHTQQLHNDCISLLENNGYLIEYDNYDTTEQPDGILVASKGCQRLKFVAMNR